MLSVLIAAITATPPETLPGGLSTSQHTFSDAVIIAAIAAIPPTLTALAALIASIRNGYAAAKAAEKAEVAVVKADELSRDLAHNTTITEVVQKQTNGELFRLTNDNAALRAEIVRLKKLLLGDASKLSAGDFDEELPDAHKPE